MNKCKICGKKIKQDSICSRCVQNLGFFLHEEINLDEEEYWKLWKSHTLCSKFSEFSSLECRDLEQCKTEFAINMLEFQSKLKTEGRIKPELEKWMEQTYLKLREQYNELPEYEEYLKTQPPILKANLEGIELQRNNKTRNYD
ncbi:MAG: hypothetical protein EU548_02840 [Promethearchaeota archaeon]|nr:MAG: hypothetical protein EU548_02840 [Candidatus Lokiarchaeota archaeon]